VTGPWDLLVVGGGSAGIVSAKTAARLGARVLLVERERTGGDCLWTGCVPSKALLAAASAAASARRASRLGVDVRRVEVDFPRVMQHVRAAIATIEPTDSPRALEDDGVSVVHGHASFESPRHVDMDGRPVHFSQAVVCTGSSPLVPDLEGLEHVEPLTSDTVWQLAELPERLAVLGGGTIGCELGQAFARLGSQVTIVEGLDRILSREDSRAAQLLCSSLEADGVRVLAGAQVVEVQGAAGGGALVLEDGTEVCFDRLLVSVGRRPETDDLGLDAAQVRRDERGHVLVNQHLRTSNPRVWAAGDVTGHAQFTHTAGVNGSLAASNALLGLRRRVDTTTVPRVTFTDPEIAAVGVDTATAQNDDRLHVVTCDHGHLDRAVVESEVEGFSKLVVDDKGRIVGATVVGPRAGETLGELAVAVRHGLRTRDLAGTIHAYPTYNDGAWDAAIADVRARLDSPGWERGVRILRAARQGWLHTRFS
jgi:pyruvate/2-oxoglutarate dehydrogenase complex dihydrolipoamide dehydrogenase (E3) component